MWPTGPNDSHCSTAIGDRRATEPGRCLTGEICGRMIPRPLTVASESSDAWRRRSAFRSVAKAIWLWNALMAHPVPKTAACHKARRRFRSFDAPPNAARPFDHYRLLFEFDNPHQRVRQVV